MEQCFAPELLVHRGIWKDLRDLGVAHKGLAIAAPIEDIISSDDFYRGLKVGLIPQRVCLAEMSVLPQMFVPPGSSALISDEVLPGVN